MKSIFFDCLKQKLPSVICFVCVDAVFAAFIILYGLPVAAAIYPTLISLAVFSVFFVREYLKTKEKHMKYMQCADDILCAVPECENPSVEEKDLIKINSMLVSLLRQLEEKGTERVNSMNSYYTVWAHQIKTPIASMKLLLQSGDSEENRRLLSMLTRIEQYVEMVLVYIRLESDDSDYVFEKTDVGTVINRCVKRFSGDFIMKRLKVDIQPVSIRCVTDEKWLSFVIEQIISNALKYTDSGEISIFSKGQTLYIKDTGIGIAREDLPRIFEKGYTGFNGRTDRGSTGLGLYLCRQITQRLGYSIKVDSRPGEGTTVSLDLTQKNVTFE